MRKSLVLTSRRPGPNRRNPASVDLRLIPQEVLQAAADIRRISGKAKTNLVGGAVVDLIQGVTPKDFDIEVFGVASERLKGGLSAQYQVSEVGKAFGVLKVHLPSGEDLDVSVPRRDNQTGKGHKGFTVTVDPTMSYADAARRRDFTINAISVDLANGLIIDPFNGLTDLENGVLRAVDPVTFVEDPLRALRAVQLLSRKAKTVDLGTKRLLRELVPAQADLPAMRVLEEWRKLLLKSKRPSMGLELLNETGMLESYPELAATRGVYQRPDAHPEGDVWEHTKQTTDVAAALRGRLSPEKQEAFMFAALLHDVGKAVPGISIEGSAHGHDAAGEAPARAFMQRLSAPNKTTDTVARLVREHMQPLYLHQSSAKPGAYDKLTRKLEDAHSDLETLRYLHMADAGGRVPGGADLSERRLQELSEKGSVRAIHDHMESMKSRPAALVPLVQGRDLIALGIRPGPNFAKLIAFAQELQDDGQTKDQIIQQVVALAATLPAKRNPHSNANRFVKPVPFLTLVNARDPGTVAEFIENEDGPSVTLFGPNPHPAYPAQREIVGEIYCWRTDEADIASSIVPRARKYLVVSDSEINGVHRGRGWGRLLYRALLDMAAREGRILISHGCLTNGATSDDAARVWQSILESGVGQGHRRDRVPHELMLLNYTLHAMPGHTEAKKRMSAPTWCFAVPPPAAKGNPVRRNPPVKFITEDSAFNRPHSSAWVHHDGFVKVLEPGFTHEQDIDWSKVQSAMPQYDPVWQQPIKEMTPEGYWLMRNVGWIAIGNPFHSRAYVPSFPSTPEALAGFALYLASAVIWHARRRENLLDVEHELTDIKTAWYVSPNPVGTYIHRYAAPGVESAMYTILESLPRPTREARPAWVENLERQKRESEREGWK